MKHASRNHRILGTVCAVALLAASCGSSTELLSETGPTTTEVPSTDATVAEANEPTTEAEGTEDDVAAEAEFAAAGVDPSLFFDGALAEEIVTVDCTLSGGEASTCYRISVIGEPADHEVGPFCPTTTSSTADEAGIWFDGQGVYDLDGDFILGLSELYDDDNWKLYDDEGNVNVTETAEEFEAAARPDVDPDLQNHCVEGRMEWLDGGEGVVTTVLVPVEPVVATSAGSTGGRIANLGVTLNGVTIAPAAPVDAILGAYTIAAFDDCGGHVNPFDGYHLHGASGCGEVPVEGHAAIFGYALDGYAVHSPYDESGEQYDDLDACGGHSSDELGYHYHAAAAAENSVIGCFSGQTAS